VTGPVRRNIVAGEPGIFPWPVARVLSRLAGRRGRPARRPRDDAVSSVSGMPERETTFATPGPVRIESGQLTPVALSTPPDASEHVEYTDDGVVFHSPGWYEVLLKVEWDPAVRRGTRFSHTQVSDHEPLHSEAISADVLAQLSGGRQLLRGNSVFGPDGTTSLVLEVWQDSGQPVELRNAALVVRELRVPWVPETGSSGNRVP
jgi:hypothetical protein